MIHTENVTYYDVAETLRRVGPDMTEETLVRFLEDNPSYGKKIDGRWYCYDLAVQWLGKPGNEYHLAGVLGLDFSDLRLAGTVLDIGAGGEGIIGQVVGERAVGIAPEEHRKGLEAAPGCGLKIMMDARDMKFLDNSFDTAAAFFTLMYIDRDDHRRVFDEVHRVLKPGGTFLLWDMVIPAAAMESKTGYVLALEIRLKDKTVQTGYGTRWKGHEQDLLWFRQLAQGAGLEIEDQRQDGHLVCMTTRKR